MDLFNAGLFSVLSINEACNTVPPGIKNVVALIISAIQIVVPILLIIWGMIDFTKAVIGQNEDKIKEAQKVFIRRLIAAAIVFLTITIVKLLISLVGTVGADSIEDSDSILDCVGEFLNGTDSQETPSEQ